MATPESLATSPAKSGDNDNVEDSQIDVGIAITDGNNGESGGGGDGGSIGLRARHHGGGVSWWGNAPPVSGPGCAGRHPGGHRLRYRLLRRATTPMTSTTAKLTVASPSSTAKTEDLTAPPTEMGNNDDDDDDVDNGKIDGVIDRVNGNDGGFHRTTCRIGRRRG